MNYQKALLEKVKNIGFNDPVGPLITINEFFSGNTDDFSIAANIDNHPTVDEFQKDLNEIQLDNGIENILIEITDIDENQWPYSERIYIIGTIEKNELIMKLDVLEPTEVEEENSFVQSTKSKFNLQSNNSKIYSVWWD
ncbi:hypothetical protein [Paenibacillus aestuarii]|uniref:DUF4253 domain-containing protein n=1 Tax=Paenibacillus aestuarii TaxID=516965 RepID=A0ABW0KFL1_9BACL|nr:hypothetical protein [Paenibacillus aestuarii]